jgi:hypothetical protein
VPTEYRKENKIQEVIGNFEDRREDPLISADKLRTPQEAPYQAQSLAIASGQTQRLLAL